MKVVCSYGKRTTKS